jgi:WD40 repeat protein/serine/threonine protein kinase
MNQNGIADAERDGRLSEVLADWLEAAERGAPPDEGEYLRRYPEFAEELAECFADWKRFPRPGGRVMRPLAAVEPPLHERGLLGDFRILREVGRGGMGVVYEAEHESLGRRVALKILHLHAGQDPRLVARFRRESRAAAQLHHTNIVPVFEVGQQGELCYYAMQFIRGQALDQVFRELQQLRTSTTHGAAKGVATPAGHLASACATVEHEPRPVHAAGPVTPPTEVIPAALPDSSELSSVMSNYRRYCRNVARLGLQAAEALAYAHGRGIIHRDIKPANLLLDSTGVLWVSDFGLVKTQDPALTDTGDLVGTLRYMAPERFRGECDVRADVYALGLTLYELLVLRPAFDGQDRLHLVDQIGRQEPARLRTLDARIPRDLETIIMKAIEKDTRRRYPSAEALAGDLRRFLADEPIQARRTGPLERLGRWGRRNPLVASLSAAIVLVAALGFAGVLAHAAQAENERNEARALAKKLQTALEQLRRTTYAAEANLANHAWDAGGTGRVRELLDKHRPKPGEADLRNFEWHYFDRLCHSEILTLKGGQVAYSPDGKRLASASYDSTSRETTVKIWDAQTGQALLSIKDNCFTDGLVFSPDGKRLASVPGCPEDLKVWDAQTGQVLFTLKQCLNCVVFSPDGKQLASPVWDPATKEGAVWLFDAQTGQKLRAFQKSGYDWVAFSPDGKRLATGGRPVKLWDARTGEELFSINDYGWPVVFSPDGKHLAIDSDADNTVKVFDAHTGRKLLSIKRSGGRSESWVAYSPDGKRLASTDQQTVKVWNAQTGEELLTFKGHTDQVTSVAFSPDGKHLASASLDGTVKVWDAQGIRKHLIPPGKANSAASMAFSADGKRLASGGVGTWDDTKNADVGAAVQVWDAQTGQEVLRLEGHTCEVTSVAFSPDGKHLASGSGRVTTWPPRPGEAKVWDAQTGHELFTLKGGAYCVAYSPDGKRLATGTDAGQDKEGKPLAADLKVWDVKTGEELLTLKGHTGEVVSVAYSPDGKRLASSSGGTWDHSKNALGAVEVKVWDAQTGKELHSLRGHTNRIMSVVFSPDSKRLASASEDKTVKVWDAQSGENTLTLKGHLHYVTSAIFSPDGERLVSVADDKTVKMWDAQTGQELLSIKGDFRSVAFTPDGHRLAAGTAGGTVSIWDATPRRAKP